MLPTGRAALYPLPIEWYVVIAFTAANTGATAIPSWEPRRPMGLMNEASPPAEVSRRRFLGWLLGLSVVSSFLMIVTPVLGFLVPPKTKGGGGGDKVLAGKTADIPPGEGKVVAMGSRPVIVVNGTGGPTAFSAICTHLGCIVTWNSVAKQITCPCHDGVFNPATGAVISGPPPAPLPPVRVTVEGDQIFLLPS